MNCCLATYIHDLSPFLIRIKGDLGIRWYGLMYVFGFIAAFLLLRWFVRLKCCELKEEKVADFITIIAIFGVMIGGRLGYMLIYSPKEFFGDPLMFFRFLDGGMASHGAIYGITLVVFIYSRWQKLSWLGLGDNLVITGPLGVFFGRIGNFINGELYGRETDHSWAMKFPNELHSIQPARLLEVVEKAKPIAPELSVNVNNLIASTQSFPHWNVSEMMIATARKNEEFQIMMADALLKLRHPSQIYQALCEGLLVFLILLAVRLKWKNAYHGFISGLFFITYAIARIAVENVRQPDSQFIMGVTKGQFYSGIMIITGIILIVYSLITKRQNQIPE
ncbi:MAG: prolipoprotein diacylglyceryl transferase [Verrucomicrobiales bacterium]|nr:prolipoprotein diacylglyceryl transferase [Verrucomicrobiales bacterium]